VKTENDDLKHFARTTSGPNLPTLKPIGNLSSKNRGSGSFKKKTLKTLKDHFLFSQYLTVFSTGQNPGMSCVDYQKHTFPSVYYIPPRFSYNQCTIYVLLLHT
jgi:hypothetical protein